MSASSAELRRWFTLRDIFNYKYECRRYLDKLVGLEDRELENEQGSAEEHGYYEDFHTAFAFWKEKKAKIKHAWVDSTRTPNSDKPQSEWNKDIKYAASPVTSYVFATVCQAARYEIL